MTQVMLCAAGFRGAATLEAMIAAGNVPARLVSYPQKGDPSRAFERIESIARREGIALQRALQPDPAGDLWVLFVGWQYLVEQTTERMVVFHDSLLPRYRGFAATATALINGEREIGTTAIRPVAGVDCGPILGQRRWQVDYPIKARAALERQATETATLIDELMKRVAGRTLTASEQDHAAATYSLWRDDQDYFIDWSQPAEMICRSVDALSFPFAGARTRVDGNEVIVDETCLAEDLAFERRDIGKVWALGTDGPVVVCGQGCVRLTAVRSLDGAPFVFHRLRCRLT